MSSKIMFVDDDPDITSTSCKFLESKGYDCTSANDGKTARKLILKNNYDYIFLDLRMPEYSGFNVLEDLKAKGYSKNNIIIVTGNSLSFKEIEQLVKMNVVSILLKPVGIRDLLKEIKKIKIDAPIAT